MLFCLSWTLHWSSELKLEFSFSLIHVFVADKRGKIDIKKWWKNGRKEREERRKKISFVRYRVEYIIPQELLLGLDLTYKQSSWRVSAFCVCVWYAALQSLGASLSSLRTTYHTQSLLSVFRFSLVCFLSHKCKNSHIHPHSLGCLPTSHITLTHILTFSLKDSTSCGIRP